MGYAPNPCFLLLLAALPQTTSKKRSVVGREHRAITLKRAKIAYLESSRLNMYAIVRDRGMQYRIEQGKTIDVALLDVEQGSEIELDEVLLIGNTDEVKVGSPLVAGAKVRAQVLGEVKGEKIIVFRYRNKKRYRRRTGHRQHYTRIKISEIVTE